MAGSKKTLENVAVHDVDIDGESYLLREMSAEDYLTYTDFQEGIESDESLSDRAKNFYRAALMGVFSLVDKKEVHLYKPDEYKSLLSKIKPDRLMSLSIEVMRINGMSETEEQTAKNS